MRTKLYLALAAGAAFVLAPSLARAAVIQVTPGDSYAKIEAAGPGDEVVIAPGTYKFRVYLTQTGTPSQPIKIHAKDPANPPVWDLTGTLAENLPGSYSGGDKARGCWQVSGGTNYVIESIVIKGCSTAGHNAAGLRYYGGASVTLRDMLFDNNDNGLTGGTENSTAVVEFSEFNHNGNLQASANAPTHNLYIYGGDFTLRYSYVHDPAQAQNFHIRAVTSVLEYNWFARAASYEGDLMTSDDFNGGTITQTMLFRGNVVLQAQSPGNGSQVVTLYNDAGMSGVTLNATLVNNTFVGNGTHAAFVHLSNADGTPMKAEIDNNIIYGTSMAQMTEDTANGVITGQNNWMATGSDDTNLTGTLFGADPKFNGAAAKDFTIGSGSLCLGGAAVVANVPDREYFQNEANARMYRVRTAVHDIGAFDGTTTGAGVGPYGNPPPGSDAGAGGSDAGVTAGDGGLAGNADGGLLGNGGEGGLPGSAGGGGTPPGSNGATPNGSDGSTGGCSAAPRTSPTPLAAFGVALFAGAAAFRKKRRPPSSSGRS